MDFVSLDSVEAGSFLAKTLYDKNGRILLSENSYLTKSLIKRLKNLEINYVYIKPLSNELSTVISPKLKEKSMEILENIFVKCEKFTVNELEFSDLSEKELEIMIEKKHEYIQTLHSVAKDLSDAITTSDNISYGLSYMQDLDKNTYEHSLNVATISLLIGVSMKLAKEDLLALGVGGLLHDVGKSFIDKSILLKPDKLTKEEFETMKKHSEKGYECFKDAKTLSYSSKMAILQHHEKVDGSGYPAGATSEEIDFFAKIVSVADVYDALTSVRPYKTSMSPNDAFEFIFSKVDSMFDFEVVKSFSKCLVPFPEGTRLKLSNGDLCIVESVNNSYPLRPIVKVIESPSSENLNKKIDLATTLSLVITSIEIAT